MATEKRLIRADVTVEAFTKWLTSLYDGRMPADIVDKIPTVDAAEVVHGRWAATPVRKLNGKGRVVNYCDCYYCSECGTDRPIVPPYNYCPNCGAKMDGDGNG